MSYVQGQRQGEEKKMKFTYTDIDYLIGEYVIGKDAKRDREILRLKFLDGLTNEKIAEIMDLSPTTVQRVVRKRGDKILLLVNEDL